MCGRIIEILETEIRRNLIYNKQHFPENVCKKINLVVKLPSSNQILADNS